jgi:phospholipase/carboxylesterase
MAADLDGPRIEPRAGAARQLVVFLHGYGADGNDLIEIGRAWQPVMPHAAFVSPHAPHPCGQAPMGREWFPLTNRAQDGRWRCVHSGAPALE